MRPPRHLVVPRSWFVVRRSGTDAAASPKVKVKLPKAVEAITAAAAAR